MTNPQNTAYFGEHQPYPIEANDFHRYLIPNYGNEVPDGDYFVFCVNDREAYQLVSVCEIDSGKLKYITFKAKKDISGRLEIRNEAGETIFYSNCVRFLDSTDDMGRKFIRIATKNLYNRNLFDYNSPYNWMITSVPAYCLGLSSVDADVSTSRTGGNNTLRVREATIDEVVEYEFTAAGDSNLLNFLQVHVTNNQFYIDGTQRTSLEKIDRDEFAMFGKLKFTNVKDKDGLNVILDYDNALDDIFVYVLGDDSKTIVYADNNNNLIGI